LSYQRGLPFNGTLIPGGSSFSLPDFLIIL